MPKWPLVWRWRYDAARKAVQRMDEMNNNLRQALEVAQEDARIAETKFQECYAHYCAARDNEAMLRAAAQSTIGGNPV